MEYSDHTLAQKIASGDEKAFEEIYMRHYPRVLGYARQYIRDVENARNVAQETFMELWRSHGSVNPSLNLLSYLMVIARNKCLNVLRGEINARKYNDTVRKIMRLDYDALADESSWELLEAEINGRIDALLDRMPDKTKEAFILSRRHGLSYAEIARATGTSVKMTEYRIMRALKYLRTNMREYF